MTVGIHILDDKPTLGRISMIGWQLTWWSAEGTFSLTWDLKHGGDLVFPPAKF